MVHLPSLPVHYLIWLLLLVVVVADALDEAKHLIKLRHKHIVEVDDVFIHRNAVEKQTKKDWSTNWLTWLGTKGLVPHPQGLPSGDYCCIVRGPHCPAPLTCWHG